MSANARSGQYLRTFQRCIDLHHVVDGVTQGGYMIAKVAGPTSIETLIELCTAMERAEAEHDAPGVYACDLAFHDELCRLSGSARLR